MVQIDRGSVRFEITSTQPDTPDLFLPVRQPSRVVLPAPLGPRMAVTWPDSTVPLSSSRIFLVFLAAAAAEGDFLPALALFLFHEAESDESELEGASWWCVL